MVINWGDMSGAVPVIVPSYYHSHLLIHLEQLHLVRAP